MAKPDLQPVVVFAGGGTGGIFFQLWPLPVPCCSADRMPQYTLLVLSKGIETRLIPQAGFPLHLIAVRGFVRRSCLPI